MDALFRKIIDPARLARQLLAEREINAVVSDNAVEPDPPEAEDIGFTETFFLQHSVVALDEQQRERERILEPGAPGQAGGPYKMLRTQVLRRLSHIGANTLAVLSASKGEGKTLTAINLAIAVAADAGQTALLIDLDLRNPTIAQRFGFEPTVGIEDCLQERRPVREAMIKVAGYERLTLLPARAAVEQSSELLAAQRTADLMHELRTRYVNRVLIVDLPPVLLADDALAFSRHVQAGLLVVAEGGSAREGITRSIRLLDKLPIVGTVLNRSRERIDAYY
jgi:capsular exopolysaccharide synthesis family protein